jgi:predicted DNA-binding transcriptional regulator AlpA
LLKRPLTKIDNADRLVRLNEVLTLLPISPASWWNGVRAGKYPRGIKLGPKTTCWRLSEITALAERGVGDASTR